MLRPRSAARAAINTVMVLPRLVGAAYRDAEEGRKEDERRRARLAHDPTRRDRLAAHLCDLSLSLASPAVKVPARDALRQVIYSVVLGREIPTGRGCGSCGGKLSE